MIEKERHDETHGELLLSASCGDLPRDDSRLLERLAACSACREELAGQDALAASFEAWGREQRQVRRDLTAGRRGAGSALVAPFLRARAAERAGRAPSPAWVPLAAAAALAVTAGGVWMATRPPEGAGRPSPVFLGESASELSLERTESGLLLVRWPAQLPPGGSFELTWRAGDGRALALPPRRIVEAHWTPSPAEAAALPETFELEVIVRGAQSEPLGRYAGTVSQ